MASPSYSGGYVPYAMTNRELTDEVAKLGNPAKIIMQQNDWKSSLTISPSDVSFPATYVLFTYRTGSIHILHWYNSTSVDCVKLIDVGNAVTFTANSGSITFNFSTSTGYNLIKLT